MATRTLLATLATCLLLAACGGTPVVTIRPTIATPSPGSTQAPATRSAAPSEVPMTTQRPTSSPPFELVSSAFDAGGAIPRAYTCDGHDTSPPLTWSGAPDGTAFLALVMTDPDASGFVHWVMFNVAASASGSIPTGYAESPDAAPQGTNSFGRVGYGGPCPPSGTHHYVLRLLALDSQLPLTGAPKAAAVLDAAKGHVLGEAKLTGTYRRG
jgi:Raf kinase inhibitor-like YbhB/YbcL family protein